MEVDSQRGSAPDPAAGKGAVAVAYRGSSNRDESEALHRIARFAPAAADQSDLMAEVALLVEGTIPCETALVCLHEAGTNQMLVRGAGPGSGRLPLWEPSIVRRVFLSGVSEIVNDVLADPDAATLTTEFVEARQMAVAALDGAGSRLGAIAALNSTSGAFAEPDLEMLSVITNRAALLIENSRLRTQRARQGRELSGLHRMTRLLAGSETVGYAIGESVRIVTDLLECGAAAIFLFDEATKSLIVQPPVAGAIEDAGDLGISLKEPSLAATVFRTDTALLSNEAASDAWVTESLRRRFDIHTLLVVPLTSAQNPIGVLLAMNGRAGAFDDADLRFTTLLGARIAAAIEASQARERERSLLQELREADRTKTEFVSMLAHELKSPMTTIKGFGEALRDQFDEISPDQRQRFLDITVKEVNRLSALVDDLLDASRVEAGSMRYQFAAVDLTELINGVLATHPSLSVRHRMAVDFSLELPHVVGDKDRIRQVLLNLLSNATRHAPESTAITISARSVDDAGQPSVRVSVSDEGIGIADSDLDRIFSKFVMLPKPDWVKPGTGLGLYIARGIVEAHGGRIWAESEPGRGATFHFLLRALHAPD